MNKVNNKNNKKTTKHTEKTTKQKKLAYSGLIKEISNRTKYPTAMIREILDTGVGVIGETVYDGRSVEIRNFGIFSARVVEGRNVQLNHVSEFNSYRRFQFKPSVHFRKAHREDKLTR